MTSVDKLPLALLAGYAHGLAITARRAAPQGEPATITIDAFVVERLAIAAGRTAGVALADDVTPPRGGSMVGVY